MVQQLLVIFFTYEFVPDHAIPSLFGYIIVVMILTVLPGPYSGSTTFDDELSLRRSSSSFHFALNNKLDFELCRTLGSNNLSLHHSFYLMSSPIDYILMKSLDKCVVIIINNDMPSSKCESNSWWEIPSFPLDDWY